MKSSFKVYMLVAATFAALSITGCGRIDRAVASLQGSAESCVSGVVYLQFTSGVTVKYLPNGKIATC